MRGNDTLVFDPGNQFTDELAPPYTVMPSSWRRFIFHVLKPRDFSLYMYLCTLCDKHSVAYPSLSQIQDDLDISSGTTVTLALTRLEELGFILRKRGALPRQRSMPHQNIYQRPSPHFTLLRLLELKKIDGNLNPIGIVGPRSTVESKAVHMMLKKLLSGTYHHYEMLDDAAERGVFLQSELCKLLDGKRSEASISFEIFQNRLAARTRTRLRKSEDALLSQVSTAVNRVSPSLNGQVFLVTLSQRLQGFRDRLGQAVDRKNILEVEAWLTSFEREVDRIQQDALQHVDEGAKKDKAAESAGQIIFSFQQYTFAVAQLKKVLSRAAADAVPF
jgi:hypothetical protein